MAVGSRKMEKPEYHTGFQVRLPMTVYNRLALYQHERPHFSLNAIVTEAIIQFLDSQKNKREEHYGN
jgi:hypothetical protein